MSLIINHLKKKFTFNHPQALILALTFAGAIPFLLLTLLLYTTWLPQAKALSLLLTYAAVILTFLGGIQWGVGISKIQDNTLRFTHIFTLSILPSLASWLILMLHAPKLQLLCFILSFIFVLSVDKRLASLKMISNWFLKLRFTISGAVIILLLLSYFAL